MTQTCYRATGIILVAGLACISGCTESAPPDSIGSSPTRSDEPKTRIQEDLEDCFVAYNRACQAGDIAKWRTLFATSRIQRLESIIASRNEELTASHIKGPSTKLIDSSMWTVRHSRAEDNHGRLQLQLNDSVKLDAPIEANQTSFAIVTLARESGDWRFFAAAVLQHPAADLDEGGAIPTERIPQNVRQMLQYEAFDASN